MNDKIYKIRLATPPPLLHPNARGSHMAKYKPRAQYKEYVAFEAMSQTGNERPNLACARLDLTWRFPKNNGRDRDNLLCWFKTAIDALQVAGIINNDNAIVCYPCKIVIEKGCVPCVDVEIQEIDPREIR